MNSRQQGFVQVGGLEKVQAVPLWRRAWRQLRRWWQLAEQRRQLAALSDAALKDIGLSRADAWQESERPFWDESRND